MVHGIEHAPRVSSQTGTNNAGFPFRALYPAPQPENLLFPRRFHIESLVDEDDVAAELRVQSFEVRALR